MSAVLSSLRSEVQEELKIFNQRFKESIKSDVPLLDRIMNYIVKRKGKQMRPLLVFYSAKLCGDVNDSTYTAASLIELLHTGTLVHDDVVDESYERRGFFSINALWKNKIAVLVGDYLFTSGFLLSLKEKEYGLLQIIFKAVDAMIRGELQQSEKARRLDITEEVYYDIIRKKTAALIAAACTAGAASVSDDQKMLDNMWDLGENLGMAFQIRDDLFDYGDNDESGKPKATDLKEQKMTLPLIYALQQVSAAEKRKMINIVKRYNTDREKADELFSRIREVGGMAYAEQKMNEYRDRAFASLEQFPDCHIKDRYRELIDFVINRKK